MIAVLYDVHGNLPALEAVLEDAQGVGADRFFLGGDYAFAGAWPLETVERLTAWTNTRNGRSQRALERVGFRREGVLASWHRHGDEMHDVVVFGMLRAAWEASRLREIPAVVEGTPPAPFVLV